MTVQEERSQASGCRDERVGVGDEIDILWSRSSTEGTTSWLSGLQEGKMLGNGSIRGVAFSSACICMDGVRDLATAILIEGS